MEVGVNLFSLRTMLQTEREIYDTFTALKKAGAAYVQYSGGLYNVTVLKNAAEILPVVLTHVPYERIVNDTETLMEEHAIFGCKNIGLGCYPAEGLFDKNKCFEIIEALEKAAIKAEKNGFKLYLHHHSTEFYRLFENKTVLDVIFERATHLQITADTYWLQHGGVCITDYLKDRLFGKVGCIHLKDYAITGVNREDLKPTYERVGYGNIDFHKVVKTAKECGSKYFLIEQDDACEKPEPFRLIMDSIDYCMREL